MTNTNDVFRKIKEMSTRVSNPRPQIPISVIASELRLLQDQILPAITELKKLRLINHDMHAPAYIKLTLLGFTVTR